VLNLRGQGEDYERSLPWVFLFDTVWKQVAAIFYTYVNNIRSGGCSELECIATTHTIASRINYTIGQQDAPRKRRHISQEPGAWAGAMVIVYEGHGLIVTCLQEKRDTTKGIIARILVSGKLWKEIVDF